MCGTFAPALHLPWIPDPSGITMALRRPHKRMKMVVRQGFDWGHASALGSPSPQSSPIKGEEESRSVSVGPVYFHSNRSCRLAPARQGMKSGSCGFVRRIDGISRGSLIPDRRPGRACVALAAAGRSELPAKL